MTEDRNAFVLYSVDDAIARIILNRPEKRNALNEDLIGAIKDALQQADSNQQVRAAIISGAGNDFCSGADLAALQKISTSSVSENLEDAQSLMELFLLIRQISVPVIAAVKGRALAGGCGLAMACDLILAARSARFGFPEVRIGFVPAMVMAMLRRNCSEKRAFELLTTGNEIGADQAEALGLINRVFEDDVFESSCAAVAAQYLKVSKTAVRLSKRLLYQTDCLALEDALRAGADVNAIARMSEDCRQGIERFLKKIR